MAAVSKQVRLHPEARAEMQASVDFYRNRGGNALAQRFKKEVASALRSVAANPMRHSPVSDLPQVRRARLRKFPFSIIYIERPTTIWIVAVAHAGRNPGYWLTRAQE